MQDGARLLVIGLLADQCVSGLFRKHSEILNGMRVVCAHDKLFARASLPSARFVLKTGIGQTIPVKSRTSMSESPL